MSFQMFRFCYSFVCENLKQPRDEVELEDDCEDENCDEDSDENLKQPRDEVDLG